MPSAVRSDEALLNVAVKAVRKGHRVLNRCAQRLDRLNAAAKQDNPTNLVTQADTEVEAAVIEEIRTFFKHDAILAEELSGEEPDVAALMQRDAPRTWVIDPIDGTTNFVHGYPHYAVALAYVEDGRVRLGVISSAATGELFTVVRGAGALLDGHAMRVSGRTQLRGALLANCSHGRETDALQHDNLATYRDLYSKRLTIRRTGSAVLDMAYVAAGRLDGFWGSGLQPWDMAAGGLMIAEAGGLISDYSAADNWMQTGQVVCGAPQCYAGILHSVMQRSRPAEEPAEESPD